MKCLCCNGKLIQRTSDDGENHIYNCDNINVSHEIHLVQNISDLTLKQIYIKFEDSYGINILPFATTVFYQNSSSGKIVELDKELKVKLTREDIRKKMKLLITFS